MALLRRFVELLVGSNAGQPWRNAGLSLVAVAVVVLVNVVVVGVVVCCCCFLYCRLNGHFTASAAAIDMCPLWGLGA